MKVAVIGAGIVGITTAYELATDGHAVTVFERRATAAEETSFANAGVIAPGYVTPWAAPGMPSKVIGHLLSRHAPVRLSLPLSGAELRWMWTWWRACKLERYVRHRAHLLCLAFYSRQRLHGITDDLQLIYDRAEGYLVLLRSAKDLAMVQTSLQVLRDAGVAFSELDAPAARLIEPALNPATALHGAIHLPEDEVGNCRQFALLLKTHLQTMGVDFRFNSVVSGITSSVASNVSSFTPVSALSASLSATVFASTGRDSTVHSHAFDAVVVCAGLDSAALLRPLGLKLPLVAVHGYSISAPIKEPLDAPRSALMDERYKVAISRLGQRVRVAGGAELGGTPGQHRDDCVQTLYKVLEDWFPGAAQLGGGVQHWRGARPMLPDGPPLIGASGTPGVWLNLGHGSSGWALSCGSARIVADQIQGREPEIDVTGFQLGRA